jgi:RNA polymerase sigma-70 factor (ECF subfamily)
MKGPETSQSSDDAVLAARAARGDQAAFATIMRSNNRALFRTARSILRDDDDAEDALQSSYLKAYLALPHFAGRSALSTWLTRIVINECLERRRRRTPQGAGEDTATAEELSSDDPESGAARAELAHALERAIDSLPEPFRVVFTLRAIEDRSVEEIAASLDIADATVRTRYHRARQFLQERLRREFRAALDGVFPFAGARCERLVARVLAQLPKAAPDSLH